MKRLTSLALIVLLAAVAVQPPAAAFGQFGTDDPEGMLPPECWVVSISLKNIGTDLPTPAATYVSSGKCNIKYSSNQRGVESTFDNVKIVSTIDWTGEGTYQPLQKNTWEDISIRQVYLDRPGFISQGTLTGWVTCSKDPWREPDGLPCGSPGYKTAGTIEPAVARYYGKALRVPLTSILNAQQRAALKTAYQSAVQAATLKAQKAKEVQVVGFQNTDKVAQQAFGFGAAPKVSPTVRPNYPLYGATYTPNVVPGMKANQTLTIPVKVMNGSSTTWPANGIYRLAYHWKSGAGYAVYDGQRTFLPAAVASGSTVALNAKLVAPSSPGTYLLQWDFVQEGVTWFSAKGVATKDQSVGVTP